MFSLYPTSTQSGNLVGRDRDLHAGRETVGVGIVRQSRANELDISDAVHAEMKAIEPSLPPGVELTTATDSTIFVREAMKEVWQTLAIAFAVVVS